MDQQTVRIESGIANLGTTPINIEMITGAGWLTHNGQDMVVRAGQQIRLDGTRHSILISPIQKNQPIEFKVALPSTIN